MKRKIGVLCHITSLPSKYGIGDLGQESYKFVDFLYENRTAVLNILKNNRSETIITVIEHAVQEKMDILVKHLNNKLNIEVPLPVIISFFGGGFTSLLLYWIENQNYTKEELLQYVKVLLNINFDD